MKQSPRASVIKLRKLKEIRRNRLEKNLLDVQLKGYDHYIFINERGKAQVITNQGNWISEHIKTAILKFNYEIDKIDKLFIRDFTDEEINEYEKLCNRISWFSFFIFSTTRSASSSISLFSNEAIKIS